MRDCDKSENLRCELLRLVYDREKCSQSDLELGRLSNHVRGCDPCFDSYKVFVRDMVSFRRGQAVRKVLRGIMKEMGGSFIGEELNEQQLLQHQLIHHYASLAGDETNPIDIVTVPSLKEYRYLVDRDYLGIGSKRILY